MMRCSRSPPDRRARRARRESIESKVGLKRTPLCMRILLVGYGKMGRLVGELAEQYGGEVAGVVDPASRDGGDVNDPRWHGVDVAIDFTTPDPVLTNVPALERQRITIVLGTTGCEE